MDDVVCCVDWCVMFRGSCFNVRSTRGPCLENRPTMITTTN